LLRPLPQDSDEKQNFLLGEVCLGPSGRVAAKDSKMPAGSAKCLKTIQNNLEMKTAFQAIPMKTNVLQANHSTICG
jgi:hypothetical protein